jgi:hypothetical protein
MANLHGIKIVAIAIVTNSTKRKYRKERPVYQIERATYREPIRYTVTLNLQGKTY